MSKLSQDIAAGIKSVLIDKEEYHLHEPFLNEDDAFAVKQVINSGWVSSAGEEINQFEQDIEKFTGVKKAVAVVNGTSALHICLKLAGVKPSDEVLCPALTFVATANAISYTGAIPNFVDCGKESLGIDSEKLVKYLDRILKIENRKIYNKNTGNKISAIVLTHVFGHPCNLNQIKAIANEYDIPVIEDAAEALGSYYNGNHVGKTGLLSALSFNGNKVITTGGGGAIITENEELAARAKHLTTTAKQPHAYEYIHDEIGYNYRMPNLNAALGVSQMKKLPVFLNKKRALAASYKNLFENIDGVEFLNEPQKCTSNFWLNAIRIKTEGVFEVLDFLTKEKIFARPLWKPLHLLQMYKDCPRDKVENTENHYSSMINIPSGVGLIRG